MTEMVTSPYDVAEHVRTPEEMAAYLDACMEEADGDAAFVARECGKLNPPAPRMREAEAHRPLECRKLALTSFANAGS